MSRPYFHRSILGVLGGVVLLAMASSPFWTVLVIKKYASEIVDDSVRSLADSAITHINISDGFVELALAISASDPAVRQKSLAQIEVLSRKTETQLTAYEATVASPIERKAFEQVIEARARYLLTRGQVTTLLREGKSEEARLLLQRPGLGQFLDYKQAMNVLVQFNAAEARARGVHIVRLCNLMLILQGVLLVFFFVYAFFVPMVSLYERITTRGDLVDDI